MEAKRPKPEPLIIALVASDDALRSSIRMLLSVSGMEVIEFRTARSYLASPPEHVGCLVVDCQLADMPGDRLCREAIQRNEHASVVMLSGDVQDSVYTTAHPNMRVVAKPFEGERLVEAVTSAAGIAGRDVGRGEGGTRVARTTHQAAS